MWPLHLFLAITHQDAEHFEQRQQIETKYFGKGHHITFHEKMEDAVLEALTVANVASINSTSCSSWVFVDISLSAEKFGDLVRQNVLQPLRWNPKFGAWRFWANIDLKTTPFEFLKATCSAVSLDMWANKLLVSYKRVNDQTCNGCEGIFYCGWQGRFDDADKVYCAACWQSYFQRSPAAGYTGRVDTHKKRKMRPESSSSVGG